MNPHVSIREAAEIYSCSTDTIRRRISDGTIPAIRVGRLIRIRREDLDNAFRSIPAAKDGAAA